MFIGGLFISLASSTSSQLRAVSGLPRASREGQGLQGPGAQHMGAECTMIGRKDKWGTCRGHPFLLQAVLGQSAEPPQRTLWTPG